MSSPYTCTAVHQSKRSLHSSEKLAKVATRAQPPGNAPQPPRDVESLAAAYGPRGPGRLALSSRHSVSNATSSRVRRISAAALAGSVPPSVVAGCPAPPRIPPRPASSPFRRLLFLAGGGGAAALLLRGPPRQPAGIVPDLCRRPWRPSRLPGRAGPRGPARAGSENLATP